MRHSFIPILSTATSPTATFVCLAICVVGVVAFTNGDVRAHLRTRLRGWWPAIIGFLFVGAVNGHNGNTAVGAAATNGNGGNGRGASNMQAVKRALIVAALKDDDLSDREIAKRLGTSARTVGRVRKAHETGS